MQAKQDLQQFEIPNTLSIVKIKDGLTKIVIINTLAEAEIYLHGGHLTHFQPKDEAPLIFDAKNSTITPSKSVHAGIPICWPWFGAHPTDASKPQHGFARDFVWHIKESKVLNSKATEVILTLQDSPQTRELFAYAFELELTFVIGTTLSVSLKTTNLDTQAFSITQALHTYFSIGDIEAIEINGVENTPFIDYTDYKKEKSENESLEVREEINRVYVPTEATCYIADHKMHREIIIEKDGSHSTTIWNPWKSNTLHDLTNDKYRKFVCIETTNALQDAKTLQPQEHHTIKQVISIKTPN